MTNFVHNFINADITQHIRPVKPEVEGSSPFGPAPQ